jgi:hypothetical protein
MGTLNLEAFLELHRDFAAIKTYTKEKHAKKKALYEALSTWDFVSLNLRRSSKTCKVSYVHDWTIFQVSENQLGKLFPLRNKWVLMYCSRTDRFDIYLQVYPLPEGLGSEELISQLKKRIFLSTSV